MKYYFHVILTGKNGDIRKSERTLIRMMRKYSSRKLAKTPSATSGAEFAALSLVNSVCCRHYYHVVFATKVFAITGRFLVRRTGQVQNSDRIDSFTLREKVGNYCQVSM